MKALPFIILAASLFRCGERQSSMTARLEGTSLPSFNVLLMDSVTYFNTLKVPIGKPIVLLFFSTDCIYCQHQVKNVLQNINSLIDIQFVFITVSPFDQLKSFFRDYHLNNYQNIVVGRDYNIFCPRYYKISAVPYLAIYDKDRKLIKTFNRDVKIDTVIKLLKG